MPSRLEMPGTVFGRLTVLAFDSYNRHRNWRWLCRCECGTSRVIDHSSLVRNATQSCGCLLREISHLPHTHGQASGGGTPTYRIWKAMRRRCRPGGTTSAIHGDRGIRVCERWQIFENFLADMGERPVGMSIDRIDNDGNYEPGNCRWATRIQQNNNTRMNRRITYRGETRTLAEWAKHLGIPSTALNSRVQRGWPIVEAFETPLCNRWSRRQTRAVNKAS